MKNAALLFTSLCLLVACDNSVTQRKATQSEIQLVRFSSCDEFRDLVNRPYEEVPNGIFPMPAANEEADAPLGETNLQTAGVDESDTAKADGDFIYALRGNSLVVLRRSPSNQAGVIQNLNLENSPSALYLTAEKIIVVSTSWSSFYGVPIPLLTNAMSYAPANSIEVSFYSRHTNGSLTLGSTKSIPDVSLSDSRMIGNQLHLVVSKWLQRETEIQPQLGSIARCNQVWHEKSAYDGEVAPYYDGLSCILSVDINSPSSAPQGECIAGSYGSAIYASKKNLFVGAYGWIGTPIHQFALADDSHSTKYIGSAVVDGTLINSFAMDEFNQHLRVAVTRQDTFVTEGMGIVAMERPPEGLNDVKIFKLGDSNPELVGSVSGIGHDGETIYAVRFLGDQGYVVTFRQTDPLTTLDLSDPRNPTIKGELVMPGYSTYLHPMTDGYLLAVGVDSETTLSIFDVRNLSHPTLLHQASVPDWTDALYDHKAFRYIPEKNMVVLPDYSGFNIFKASVSGGISLLARSPYETEIMNDDGTYSYYYSGGARAFYREGNLDLLGGSEFVLRSADSPATDIARIQLP